MGGEPQERQRLFGEVLEILGETRPGFGLLPPVNAGLLRADTRSAMLAVRTDELLITRAVASLRQREVRVH
jgi:hypothetical protein